MKKRKKMSKTSYWLVAFDHETETWMITDDTFEFRFGGVIKDDEYKEKQKYAEWDLEQGIEGLNLMLIDRDED